MKKRTELLFRIEASVRDAGGSGIFDLPVFYVYSDTHANAVGYAKRILSGRWIYSLHAFPANEKETP